jgi:uncharacterized protein (DUF1697 family)
MPAPLSVALLRAVNVGGHNKVPMAELRALCAALGWRDVSTYVQSGNVVFRADDPHPGAALRVAIAERFDVQTPVIVRTHAALQQAAAAIPPGFTDDPKKLHVLFLDGAPDPAVAAALDTERYAPDRFAVDGDRVYLHFPNGAGQSKLNLKWLERALGATGTARNLRTVHALIERSAPR